MRAALIGLLFVVRCFALPAIVQSGNNFTGGAATTLSVPFSSSNTARNCLIASTVHDPASNTSTVSDTQGNLWRRAFVSSLFFNVLEFWYAANVAAGPNTVTVTNVGSGQDFLALGIAEVSGLSNCAVDQTSELVTSSVTSWNSGAKTTGADGELIIGWGTFAFPPGGNISAGSGFTQLENVGGDIWEYFVQGSRGSIAAPFTADAAVNAYAYMITMYSAPILSRTGIF